MNKKGFTLIEMLVVIALLGVLMVLIVPNVTGTLNDSKKNLFYNEVLNLYSNATTTYLLDGENGEVTYCSEGTNKIDVDVSDDFRYRVVVGNSGVVQSIEASGNGYYIIVNSINSKKDIKKDNISTTVVNFTCD